VLIIQKKMSMAEILIIIKLFTVEYLMMWTNERRAKKKQLLMKGKWKVKIYSTFKNLTRKLKESFWIRKSWMENSANVMKNIWRIFLIRNLQISRIDGKYWFNVIIFTRLFLRKIKFSFLWFFSGEFCVLCFPLIRCIDFSM
jgi:hypothetical protein